MTTRRPAAPPGLGAPGRRLWRSVLADHELRADELAVLERAARLADRLAELDEARKAVPVIDEGSKDQTRVHPVYAELRLGEVALGTLLRQLGLHDPDEGDDPNAGSRSSAARSLAFRRWGR